MEVITQLDARRIRAALPEGMMGGAYARPDEDMQVIWDAGVAEVRQVIETGWLA
jgi:creatinine amidohydrolase